MNSEINQAIALHEPDSKVAELSNYYDEKYRLEWIYMHAHPRPCFSPSLLSQLLENFDELRNQTQREVDYVVLASNVEGIFNLGGDLNLFCQLIRAKNYKHLMEYAKACIDALYIKMIGFDRDITHISLVQGDALGGGFECALASHVLIAERSAKLGLPEVLFNLFPGMGAYSFLSRKLNPALAERIILSGKLYTAHELYELGVVDVLVEDGEGVLAVYDHIRRESKARNAHLAMRKVKSYCNPVTYEELRDITEIWVDAALRLTERDLRMMERLVARQNQKLVNTPVAWSVNG